MNRLTTTIQRQTPTNNYNKSPHTTTKTEKRTPTTRNPREPLKNAYIKLQDTNTKKRREQTPTKAQLLSNLHHVLAAADQGPTATLQNLDLVAAYLAQVDLINLGHGTLNGADTFILVVQDTGKLKQPNLRPGPRW